MSKNRMGKGAGPDSARWKGGEFQAAGRWFVKSVTLSAKDRALAEPMAMQNGYVLRARLVLAKSLGRPLMVGEVAHHLNGKKDDDRPENLAAMQRSAHSRYHTLKAHREGRYTSAATRSRAGGSSGSS